ncbi:hypothetical protein PSACC_03300 [Paramicrosporidium saccamoebae]|uniref:Uncharacterized protein n=1 Tax=Paramicrosporidium saccamoebae TaxID=1246581 RepID=A0A2H9TGH6_9FUNG|nr:hypothetical protein PSACC_03300 [Paramicrosporidium saccamoebae]
MAPPTVVVAILNLSGHVMRRIPIIAKTPHHHLTALSSDGHIACRCGQTGWLETQIPQNMRRLSSAPQPTYRPTLGVPRTHLGMVDGQHLVGLLRRHSNQVSELPMLNARPLRVLSGRGVYQLQSPSTPSASPMAYSPVSGTVMAR